MEKIKQLALFFAVPGRKAEYFRGPPLKIKTSHGTRKRTGIALKHNGVGGISILVICVQAAWCEHLSGSDCGDEVYLVCNHLACSQCS